VSDADPRSAAISARRSPDLHATDRISLRIASQAISYLRRRVEILRACASFSQRPMVAPSSRLIAAAPPLPTGAGVVVMADEVLIERGRRAASRRAIVDDGHALFPACYRFQAITALCSSCRSSAGVVIVIAA